MTVVYAPIFTFMSGVIDATDGAAAVLSGEQGCVVCERYFVFGFEYVVFILIWILAASNFPVYFYLFFVGCAIFCCNFFKAFGISFLPFGSSFTSVPRRVFCNPFNACYFVTFSSKFRVCCIAFSVFLVNLFAMSCSPLFVFYAFTKQLFFVSKFRFSHRRGSFSVGGQGWRSASNTTSARIGVIL